MKKNYTISIPAEKFWTIIIPLGLIIIAVGGTAGMLIVDRFIMPGIVGVSNRGIIDVPNLVGKDSELARQELYNIGLRIMVSEKEYSKTVPAGVVISQQPLPGQTVKKGRHISAIVSNGPEVAAIPDVRNLAESVARRKLRDAGFHKVEFEREYHERCALDLAIGSTPPPGVRTSRELPISVMISKGPRPTHATVPNVVGEMLSEAKQIVEDNNLTVGAIDYRSSSGGRAGFVVSQSPPPGKSVPLESPVDIIVAAGN